MGGCAGSRRRFSDSEGRALEERGGLLAAGPLQQLLLCGDAECCPRHP
ncbi:T0120697 isoform 2 [Pongo abelii]|uniref:T0120697 isoform 2 n=1 Tax=Pongo abelii TaxID=9601 RepID=A0A2J8TK14_PONAB|nr:T0120697 isoform 2 [Pongo abelii]